MNNLDFTFEEDAHIFADTADGGMLSASHFLTVMEGRSEDALEDALLELESRGIMLDISDLPVIAYTGEAALRLRREAQLVKQPNFWTALEENDPLRLYLEELAALPACGDEAILAKKSAAGSETAREQLLNLSLGRVVELATELTGHGVLMLDLIQEGSLGLWQAIVNYAGGDFSHGRDWWIRSAMAKLITLQARDNGVGQKMRQALEDYKEVDERLLSELGRNATTQEIAEEMHISADEAACVKNMLDSARLMNRAKAENEPDEEDPEDEQHVEDTALFQMRQRISDLLSGLSDADAKLLTLRFGLEGGLPLSPEDAGRKLGLTPEEVISREAAALAKLRNE